MVGFSLQGYNEKWKLTMGYFSECYTNRLDLVVQNKDAYTILLIQMCSLKAVVNVLFYGLCVNRW